MRRLTSLVILFCLTWAVGCGGAFSKAEMDRAKQALDAGLLGWKQGEKLDKLQSKSEAIAFYEDWAKAGQKLLVYEIVNASHTDNEKIRFLVRLELQDRRGRREKREATYAVVLKSPITIARDPYF